MLMVMTLLVSMSSNGLLSEKEPVAGQLLETLSISQLEAERQKVTDAMPSTVPPVLLLLGGGLGAATVLTLVLVADVGGSAVFASLFIPMLVIAVASLVALVACIVWLTVIVPQIRAGQDQLVRIDQRLKALRGDPGANPAGGMALLTF